MKKCMVLLILSLVAVSLQAKETWLFIRPISLYYDAAKLFVICDLLKQELQVQGNADIKMVERPENGPDLESDAKARKEALGLTGTDVGFTGKVSQIDNTVFFYVYKWNKSGDLVYQARVSVPVGEDPEALVKRLAVCLITHEKFSESATNETVMVKDSKQPRRKEGALILLARAGILYPYGNSYRVLNFRQNYTYDPITYVSHYDTLCDTTAGNTPSFEFGVGYDVNFMIIEATIGFDGTRDFKLSIAGEYLFGKGDFCPYAGGEIGLSLVSKATGDYIINVDQYKKNSDGMHGGLRVGYLLFRNHKIKFMPEIRAINVFNNDWDKGISVSIGMMASF
jgi:hypothetical protein